MNTIKKLTESISNFFTEIANHYEIPSSEIVSTLMEINFYSLFQTLCREAEPVYAFRSYGKDDCLLNYWGEKLFPCKAILLYRMPDYVADEGRIATMHFLEVWLREDLSLAVTACFHIENRAAKYYSSYRVHKGCVWPYDEDAFCFEAFVEGLFRAAPGVTEDPGAPFFEP